MRFFTIFIISLFGFQLYAQVVITDDDLQAGTTYNWTNDNVYLLDGLVVLEEGGQLNIEAGTVIKGKYTPTNTDVTASGLIIASGAQIFAEGTADDPVVFTAEIDDINDDSDITFSDRGLWGGLYVLGNAPIAADSLTESTIFCQINPSCTFGGNDEFDNSGVLQYVSIRHAGAAPFVFEEMAGLYLGGVGSETLVSNIEVYSAQDDAISIGGGTVNLKYLSVSFNGDESIDWDLGWRGKGQFWLAVQAEDGDKCGEHDGAKPDLAGQYSNPTISNVTYIGAGMNVTDGASEALLFRDRSAGSYSNSIFINFPQNAISVEDRSDIDDSYDHIQSGELVLNCNYFWDFGAGNTWADLVNVKPLYADQTGSAVINMLESNQNTIADPLLMNLDTDPAVFDPRLAPGSPAGNAACVINDPFFDPVTYVGAFDSDDIWLQLWTGMDANLFFAFVNAPTSTETLEGKEDVKIYPNPTSHNFVIEGLTIPANIQLFSLEGRLLQEHQTNDLIYNINVNNLPEGVYLVKIKTSEGIISKKITKVK